MRLLQAEAQLLGSTRGKEVRLMVHHSRNSEQKQWDETVVIALGGMGRLLKAHLPAVVQLEAFPAGPPWFSDLSLGSTFVC